MADRPNVEEVFEAWAHVAARIRKRSQEEQERILAGLEIGPEWASVHEIWSKRLNDDIVASRMDRPKRYAQICREEQLRRQRASAAPPSPDDEITQTPAEPPAEATLAQKPLLQQLGAKPLRARAETVDIQGAPTGDAMPFAKKPAVTDFRDKVTPQRVKPNFPWMEQETTIGAVAGAATNMGSGGKARTPSTAPSDFRRGLRSGGQGPNRPRPDQNETASGENLSETVEAARQVSEIASWTVKRWAQLTVALERYPQNSGELWAEQGITSVPAREHGMRQWQKRLSKEPSVKAEMMGYVAKFRAGQ